ncbi:replication restart DNA helicase PriA [Natranaerovirga hydrolytica]|uniref:Replication restart protein PriA n=1 Tax=Natranaerovirga hydrolytica TaxID=680378 RepID=A0A4R1N5R5_9FIRM|nr:primosomal protein N' [Natranaerovirga hydrolytica]TCK98339.1 replication restart DNA helicase PriA [Natranaerovirga hydrolytica]
MAQRFADIIVDVLHQDLNKTFQYIIPESIQDDIKIGSSVHIPFGKGNKNIRGFVINITNEPQIDPSKLKAIIQLSQKEVGIEEQLIQLAIWISKKYGSTLISALKTVLPIQQKVKHQNNKYINLRVSKEEASKKLIEYKNKKYVAMARLLEHLLENDVLEHKFVSNQLKISRQTIERLEQQEIIQTTTEKIYRKPHKFEKNNRLTVPTTQQNHIIDTVIENMQKNMQKTYLLHGITGSGKTEIYIRLIENVLKDHKQGIVLIPEISLTHQTVKRFYERFGSKVGVIHSRLSQGERYDQYIQAKNGEIQIMVGPRSALFAPFNNLGIIIIDEEHESTYKSDTTPKYHAREVAIKRAEMSKASVVLGSATPSIESYYNAMKGHYHLLEINERIENRPLPQVTIIDMREELEQGNKTMLSEQLHRSIEERLQKKEQIIIFINRRGYSRFVSCRQCGFVLKCNHCDVAYTYHNNHKLICHYCGDETVSPKVCPSCQSKYIKQFGIGTQQVEAYLNKTFPNSKILRMDMDTTTKKNSYEKILTGFYNQEADILIGTQMVAKGHDFPNVTLVGVLAADLSLYMNDFRANERTFSLLTQVAGRAGRAEKAGEVLVQTYSPDHYSIGYAQKQDYKGFYNEEIAFRELMGYPPFSNIMALLLVSKDEKEVIKQSYDLANTIKKVVDANDYDVIGPSPAFISKINNLYRQVIYIKSKEYNYLLRLKKYIDTHFKNNSQYNNTNIQFDYNPLFSY